MKPGDLLTVHSWPAFWTVICLGLIQVALTYCGGHLAIESLPERILLRRGKTYRWIFTALLVVFVLLTFTLAKLNDSNQHHAQVVLEQERDKQEALQLQLRETFDAVQHSRTQLEQLKQVIDAHPPGAERSAMLASISNIQHGLAGQMSSMKTAPTR